MASKTCVIYINRGQKVHTMSEDALFSLCFSFVTSEAETKRRKPFLISNFLRVLNVVFFRLGDTPASEFCTEVSEHSVPSL